MTGVAPLALPWSQACENNKAPILEVLRECLAGASRVLEIGTGTAQHAVHFASALPHLTWVTSDRGVNLPGIRARLEQEGMANIEPPVELDVTALAWPTLAVDAAFSANTAHIMDWTAVQAMFRGVAQLLPAHSPFLLYGPFNYGGRHTSDGNARFDASLRAQPGGMGIRDIEAVTALGAQVGLELTADREMPANNRTLVFARQ